MTPDSVLHLWDNCCARADLGMGRKDRLGVWGGPQEGWGLKLALRDEPGWSTGWRGSSENSGALLTKQRAHPRSGSGTLLPWLSNLAVQQDPPGDWFVSTPECLTPHL